MKNNSDISDIISKVFETISDQEMQYEELVHAVSEEINRIMLEKNMTKSDLAQKMGTSRPYVTKLLRGSNVSLQTLVKISSAFEYKVCVSMIPCGWDYRVFAVSPAKRSMQQQRRAMFADDFKEKEGLVYACVESC